MISALISRGKKRGGAYHKSRSREFSRGFRGMLPREKSLKCLPRVVFQANCSKVRLVTATLNIFGLTKLMGGPCPPSPSPCYSTHDREQTLNSIVFSPPMLY